MSRAPTMNKFIYLFVFFISVSAVAEELTINADIAETRIDELQTITTYQVNVFAKNTQLQAQGEQLTRVAKKNNAEEVSYTLTGQPAQLNILNADNQQTQIIAKKIIYFLDSQQVIATENVTIDNSDFNAQCHKATYKIDGSYSKCEKKPDGPQTKTLLKNTQQD